jgi:lysophospholipase L1-like esterase
MAGTSAAVLDGLSLPKGPPLLVILLMIGTNDMGWIEEGVPGALANLRRIVSKVDERYDNQACIALASIPPLHCTNRSPAPEYCTPSRSANWAAYNIGVRAIANEHPTDRIHYVPVAEGLPGGGQYALELSTNYGDVVHPNDEGYAAMATVWADVVGKIGKRVQSGMSDPCKGPLD